jgi:hypothetical protein
MLDRLEYFSLKDNLWIQFSKNYISVGLPQLEKDIHLTISFHQDDKDINLHLTKNSSDSTNKPKVEICRIDKKLLEVTVEETIGILIHNVIEPLNCHADSVYVSMEDIQTQTEQVIPKLFNADDYSVKNKRKLKVKANLIDKITSISEMEDFKNLYYEAKRKPITESSSQMESGIILNEGDPIPALKFSNGWYKLRELTSFTDLLKAIVDDRTINGLKMRFKRALVVVKRSETFGDTEPENRRSIRLQ